MLADRNPTIPFLRSLADQNPTIQTSNFYDHRPIGIQRTGAGAGARDGVGAGIWVEPGTWTGAAVVVGDTGEVGAGNRFFGFVLGFGLGLRQGMGLGLKRIPRLGAWVEAAAGAWAGAGLLDGAKARARAGAEAEAGRGIEFVGWGLGSG